MITLIVDKLPRITLNRKKLEKVLEVKITNNGKEVCINGEAENEYIAEKVIEALDFGFPYASAISIKIDDNLFEKISIKEHTKRKDLETIRARIIGKNGKTIKTLSLLSECFLELKDNVVGIIGPPENIYNAQTSVISIIKGSKQSNVYSYLEKHRPEKVLPELIIKRESKKL